MAQLGYDPDFIGNGIRIPLPTFSPTLGRHVLRKPGILRKDIYSDHIHFTLVMHETRKQLVYSAWNFDQQLFEKHKAKHGGRGSKSWTKDKDIGRENQLGNEFYKDRKAADGSKIPNPFDRGHMVMRSNNMWGETLTEVDKAGKATYIYANASFQHENLNQDEWVGIEEDIVQQFRDDANDRLSVFTGPIFGHLDRSVILSETKQARVPSGFFKVICYQRKDVPEDQKLGVLAFAVFQDDAVLRDDEGRHLVKTDRRYQVTIKELSELTGINFGDQLFNANPLFYFDQEVRRVEKQVNAFPERRPVGPGHEVVADPEAIRPKEVALPERQIIINGAMINPFGNERKGEWVTLLNRGSETVWLNQWRLVDGRGRTATLDASLPPGHSICLDGDELGTIKLSNSGGSMMLFDASNALIDHVTWSKAEVNRLAEGVALMFDDRNS